MCVLENIRYLVLHNAARQPFRNGSLAHAGLANQQRVVLAAPTQGLDDALQFQVASNQWIDLAGQRLCIEVQRVVAQRAALARRFNLCLGLGRGFLFADLCGLVDAVGDVVHHIQARDVALVEEIHRVRFLFAKQGHQDVGAVDFLLVGRLHVQDGALDDALETDRRLGVGLAAAGQDGGVAVDEVGQRGAQLFDIRTTGAQHLCRRRIVEHGQQQVLDRDEFVPFLAGFDKGQVEVDFKFLRDHLSPV